MDSYRFVDMFAGLGGFHAGLGRLGMKCVFACEKNKELSELYARNYSIFPSDDIRKIDADRIPDHEIFCAGFPCQPFSKAGEQLGLSCEKDGDLFENIIRILSRKNPPFVFLENVANLEQHNNSKTYKSMCSALRRLGYHVIQKVLSPDEFGIPQVRKRLFVIAGKFDLSDFLWPEKRISEFSVYDVLDEHPEDARYIDKHYIDCIDVWQEFLDSYPENLELPSFPIWSMEFGATYPVEDNCPHQLTVRCLSKYRGAFGVDLSAMKPADRLSAIPRYASAGHIPGWKRMFIQQNRMLFENNKKWLVKWCKKIRKFPFSLQKFEWNCKGESRIIRDHVLQFRASGLRVKRSRTAPALIAMTTTQVPIIGKSERFMTVRECARLQGMGELPYFPKSDAMAYRALGNAINADIVELIGRKLIEYMRSISFSRAG